MHINEVGNKKSHREEKNSQDAVYLVDKYHENEVNFEMNTGVTKRNHITSHHGIPKIKLLKCNWITCDVIFDWIIDLDSIEYSSCL